MQDSGHNLCSILYLDRQNSKVLPLHLESVETAAIGENLQDGQKNIDIIEN